MSENESLDILLQRIVDACREFNDAVFYHRGFGERLAKLYREQIGYVGLQDIKDTLKEIAPPIEAEDREHRLKSIIKSQKVGDIVTEDEFYYIIQAAAGWFDLIKSEHPEGVLLSSHKAFQAYLNDIKSLSLKPTDDPKGWGKVITNVIWLRHAEEILHVQKADLEQGGKIYIKILDKAEAECAKRKRSKMKGFQHKCGMDVEAFRSLNDREKQKVLEDRSSTPEERDKAGVRATRLKQKADEILSMCVSDGDLKTAFQERIIQRIGRTFR